MYWLKGCSSWSWYLMMQKVFAWSRNPSKRVSNSHLDRIKFTLSCIPLARAFIMGPLGELEEVEFPSAHDLVPPHSIHSSSCRKAGAKTMRSCATWAPQRLLSSFAALPTKDIYAPRTSATSFDYLTLLWRKMKKSLVTPLIGPGPSLFFALLVVWVVRGWCL
jgi:hypothetical protein